MHSDAEKRRLVRAVIRDPFAARFRAGEKKAEGQLELSRSRRVRAQDLLESDEVAFLRERNLSGTAGYIQARLKDYTISGAGFCIRSIVRESRRKAACSK